MAYWSKILIEMKSIVKILTFGIVFIFAINSCKSDGVRSFYCLSNDKCVTIWKTESGDVFVIYGTYKNLETPIDDYVKVLSSNYNIIHLILSKDNKLLIDVDKSATVIKQSSNNRIELYKENKAFNDSIYTYFDGGYKRYKKEVDFISVNIKENYAIDKTGNKMK